MREGHHCAELNVNIDVISSHVSILTDFQHCPNRSAIAAAIQAPQEGPWAPAKQGWTLHLLLSEYWLVVLVADAMSVSTLFFD